jgi:hypothetical protein
MLSLAEMQNGPEKEDFISSSLETSGEIRLLEEWRGLILWQAT